MGDEVELKLEVPPGAMRTLRRLPALRRGSKRMREKDLVSVYFDTAKHKLRKNGMSLRVRHVGDKRVQTLKANGHSAAGLHRREEWEAPIRSDTPSLQAIRRTAASAMLNKKLRRALKPVFETRIHRTVVPLERAGSRIDVSLDQGQVRLGRKSAPISEVELELKRGQPAELFAIAREVSERVPARLAVRTKADRGYELVGTRPAAAVAAAKVKLVRGISTAEAFHAIALDCLHHVAANERAVGAHDSEGVHQMRVGLRRLRAAIAVFSDLLDDDQTARIMDELKWLTGELSPARDLDVYLTGNIKPLQRTLPHGRGLDALRHDLEARRAHAFAQAKRAVESPRYRALVLDTLAWIEGGGWTSTDDRFVRALRRRDAATFARDELARRAKKTAKKAKKLARLDARQRHKLRIAIKKLRYAVDFFAGLYDTRKARRRLRRFRRELKGAQDCLGALNDISVHQKLAGTLVGAKRRRRERAFAIGVASGREQARIEPLRAAAVAATDRLVAARPFWR